MEMMEKHYFWKKGQMKNVGHFLNFCLQSPFQNKKKCINNKNIENGNYF